MPLTPAFTVSQSGLTPQNITVTDTSTGSDVAITQRRIYFQTAFGTYLVEEGTSTDYEAWSYADASATFDVLDSDHALSITVQWLNVGGTVLYTLTQLFAFPQYNKNFFYYLIQQQALAPNILQDKNYFLNMATYWMNIVGGIQAVELGADISASQNCLDAASFMKDQQSKYF